jgi:hypothetical protein
MWGSWYSLLGERGEKTFWGLEGSTQMDEPKMAVDAAKLCGEWEKKIVGSWQWIEGKGKGQARGKINTYASVF